MHYLFLLYLQLVSSMVGVGPRYVRSLFPRPFTFQEINATTPNPNRAAKAGNAARKRERVSVCRS